MNVKVVLFRSVDNLGNAGETVDVKPGYFRNYLGPRGLAKIANRANLALVESRRKKIEAMVAQERTVATDAAKQLNGIVLTFQMRSNDKGQLFGSVTAQDVAKALADKGFVFDRRKIELPEHIKALGTFPFRIRLYPGVFAELKVLVERFLVPEDIQAAEEEAAAAAARAASAEATGADEDVEDLDDAEATQQTAAEE